jgi:hypothetical protein
VVADRQLSLDGTEVPVENAWVARAPSSPTQKEILKHLRENGSISPKEAGLILYAVKEQPWRAPYASSDGSEVLRLMALRGLVHKESRGRWVAGPGPRPPLRRSEKIRKGLDPWADA